MPNDIYIIVNRIIYLIENYSIKKKLISFCSMNIIFMCRYNYFVYTKRLRDMKEINLQIDNIYYRHSMYSTILYTCCCILYIKPLYLIDTIKHVIIKLQQCIRNIGALKFKCHVSPHIPYFIIKNIKIIRYVS